MPASEEDPCTVRHGGQSYGYKAFYITGGYILPWMEIINILAYQSDSLALIKTCFMYCVALPIFIYVCVVME